MNVKLTVVLGWAVGAFGAVAMLLLVNINEGVKDNAKTNATQGKSLAKIESTVESINGRVKRLEGYVDSAKFAPIEVALND